MCQLNYPFSNFFWDDSINPPFLPRGIPQLMWATPVDISHLGASLEAYSKTLPQITTLRLCHRFGDCALSKLPQEILELIEDDFQKSEREPLTKLWHGDFLCFQGQCEEKDHYGAYGENVERFWQKEVIEGQPPKFYTYTTNKYTENQKVKIIQKMIKDQSEEDGTFEITFDVHVESFQRWSERTCLCSISPMNQEISFLPLNNILKKNFGLEAIIIHEALSEEMRIWKPRHIFADSWDDEDRGPFSTTCYITPAFRDRAANRKDSRSSCASNALFSQYNDFAGIYQTIDSALLSISDEERRRFARAMRHLGLNPCYHFNELEPHIKHPIQDELLQKVCGRGYGCTCSTLPGLAGKRQALAEFLETKNKELAKLSWPRLMLIAASSVATPHNWSD